MPLCVEPGVAFFPHGYRKKKGDAVSPRALKHLCDLIEIANDSDAKAIMCYVIQRGDANSFIPSETDPIYKAKFYEAKDAGVEMRNLFVEWQNDGSCFSKNMPYFPRNFHFFLSNFENENSKLKNENSIFENAFLKN